MSKNNSFDNWMLTLAVCGVFTGFLAVTGVCGPIWIIRKGTKPALEIIVAIGKWSISVLRKLKNFIPKRKEPEVPVPEKKDYAEIAVQEYEKACGLIDDMPLEKSEKGSMKIHVKRQFIEQLWRLMK